jgi:hypothetical protein
LVAQRGLADARLADEQDEPAVTPGRGIERPLELAQLILAAHKGLLQRQASPGQLLLAGLIGSRLVRVQSHERCRAL